MKTCLTLLDLTVKKCDKYVYKDRIFYGERIGKEGVRVFLMYSHSPVKHFRKLHFQVQSAFPQRPHQLP